MASVSAKTISLTVLSTTTAINAAHVITSGDSAAYTLEITFSDITAITGTCQLHFAIGSGTYADRDDSDGVTITNNKVSYLLPEVVYASSGLVCYVQFINSNLYTPLKITFSGIRVLPGGTEAATAVSYPAWVTSVASAEALRVIAESARVTAESARALLEAYSAATNYVIGNKVTYLGSCYQCTANSAAGHSLPTETAHWAQIASKGDTGATGATGATGVAGNNVTLTNMVNGAFATDDGWYYTLATGGVADGELTFTASARYGAAYCQWDSTLANHVYYITLMLKVSSGEVRVRLYNNSTSSDYVRVIHSGTGEYTHISMIGTVSADTITKLSITDYRTADWDAISVKEVSMFDLGESFGVGLEPTIVPLERLLIDYNTDYYVPTALTIDLGKVSTLDITTTDWFLAAARGNAHPIYVSLASDVMNVITKYNATQDLRVVLQKKLPNSLFDFQQFLLIDNATDIVSTDITAGTVLQTIGSDMLGPYKIIAAANADGDLPDSTDFTGGMHGYNGDGTGTATASNTALTYFVDGRKVTSYSDFCNKVDVFWINQIQGSNTKKEAGGGREILKESFHLHYDGSEWQIECWIECLEALQIQRHYGLEALITAWNTACFYHNSTNRAWNDATGNSNSTVKTCNRVTFYKGSNFLEMETELLGCGDMALNIDGTYSVFVESSVSKAYFDLFNSAASNDFSLGDTFSFRGCYRFYSK